MNGKRIFRFLPGKFVIKKLLFSRNGKAPSGKCSRFKAAVPLMAYSIPLLGKSVKRSKKCQKNDRVEPGTYLPGAPADPEVPNFRVVCAVEPEVRRGFLSFILDFSRRFGYKRKK
jgi:hypothetical protein